MQTALSLPQQWQKQYLEKNTQGEVCPTVNTNVWKAVKLLSWYFIIDEIHQTNMGEIAE